MITNDHVIIRKLKTLEGADFEGLALDYEVEGFLLESINLGCSIHVMRWRRNDVYAMGHFTTSPARSIEPSLLEGRWLVTTENSLYEVEVVRDTERAADRAAA